MSNRPIKLEELIPDSATFKLRASGDRVYTMRPFDLDDEKWLNSTFGDGLSNILHQRNWAEIARIVFHQLELEDQRFFKKQDVIVVAEDGSESTVTMGGTDLLCKMIRGIGEKQDLLRALLHTIGISQPVQERLEAIEGEKKSLQNPSPTSPPTGLKSSTSSKASTDGRTNTSGHEPEEGSISP